jgi:CRISPR-associated protein (TIGR03986 family)
MKKKHGSENPPRPAGGTLQGGLEGIGFKSSKPVQPAKPAVSVSRASGASGFGRAPYNFVPLPEAMKVCFDAPPPCDRYDGARLSGEIVLRIEAETAFYIRGMWPFADYIEKNKKEEQTTRPFEVFQHLRLPGSSLRGMVRTLVEILAKAPLEPINDTQLFFRAVGASDKEEDDSYEPHASEYKARMFQGSGETATAPLGPRAMAGFLHPDRSGWWIRPAQIAPHHGTSWYRPETFDKSSALRRPQPVYFQPVKPSPGKYSRGIHYNFGIIKQSQYREVKDFGELLAPQEDREGWIKGWLISPGWMQGRHWNWIILPEDTSAKSIRVEDVDRDSYLESGATPDLKAKKLDYSPERAHGDEGIPCFFVQWKDAQGNGHVSFGHTPYFRLPYITTPRDANPAKRPDGDKWDLAQLLFGRAPDPAGKREGARGRVFFEDAMLVDKKGLDTVISESVLGQPKPTTYQHYLVQTSDDGKESIHWDTPGAALRGHKMYWHRPGASTAASPDAKEKVKTRYQKALPHNVFQARIRFENLEDLELGALLTALELPEGCRHHLGMGKPIGLGSFHIGLESLSLIQREQRYSAFFTGTPDKLLLETGSEKDDWRPVVLKCKKRFAAWYLDPEKLEDQTFQGQLWKDDRLVELKAMLTWPQGGTAKEQEAWLNKTRYLGFGSVNCQGRAVSFNEYIHAGDPCKPKRESGRRRPLPKARVVLSGAPGKVPDDPAPLWLTENQKRELRSKNPRQTTGPGRPNRKS